VVLLSGALLASRQLGLPDQLSSPLADSPEESCSRTTLQVSVTPRLADVLERALDQVGDPSCTRFVIQSRGERAVADAVFYGGAVPDLWVPDGDWSLDKLPVEVVSPTLASTPVVLVGGAGAGRPDSWGDALTSGSVAMPDPLDDSVGTLAMLAPRQEAQLLGDDVEAARSFLVPTAQAYGEVASDGREMDLSTQTLTATSTRLVATTEQELLGTGPVTGASRVVVPRTGAALIRFPLAVRDDAPAVAREVAEQVAGWFGSDEGADAVVDAGLRPGDGSDQEDVGLGRLRYLPAPAGPDVDDYRFTWQVMSVPSSVLAVLDVSGSMDFVAGSTRRIDVATGAADVALGLFPGHARVGLWAFSIDQGGPGQDWRVLEPVRRLDATVAGTSQRDRLRARMDEVGTLTTGGTGLYDTALAAYRQALRIYDPAYANSVIVLTDGANDDPGSISGNDLLRRLRALRDPQRPVRIIGIAISDDADLAALRRIAEATGGRAHRADAPDDILRVFAQEIANR
jgi:Mg-chelatase subunit ChlD